MGTKINKALELKERKETMTTLPLFTLETWERTVSEVLNMNTGEVLYYKKGKAWKNVNK